MKFDPRKINLKNFDLRNLLKKAAQSPDTPEKPPKVKRERPNPGESAVTRFSKEHPIVYMTLTLFVLTAVISFALGFVNMQTAPVRAQLKKEQIESSVLTVVPGSKSFMEMEDVTFNVPMVKSARAVFDGADSAGHLVGYAIEVTPSGFGGAIDMLVGVSPDGKVTGAAILEMKETPNLGTKTADGGFLDRFTGLASGFTWGAPGSGKDVDVISGATVSSNAVSAGVEEALRAVTQITEGGTAG